MHPNFYKQVKKMNKCLKAINSIGYVVFLKDGPHYQLMKVEKKFKKNKQKKEKKPKHESFAIFGEWVSGGEESSASSSDESNKKFTTCMGSSSNTCFMAKGMDSDVSDDDSDSPSIDELLDLVHEHQKVIKKQSKEIKNLNALNNLNASLATNFEDLMCKFNLLSKEHEELKLKFESINDTNDSLEMKQTIPCAIPISRVDASTSCIDLIDNSCSNPCNEKCNENVVVESCDDLIAKENDELKQEVERLMKDLYRLKGKEIESNVQPSQDNREDMVKKLEKGSTMTCSKCHKEGHKSNKCPQPRKKLSDEKNKKKLTIKSSLI